MKRKGKNRFYVTRPEVAAIAGGAWAMLSVTPWTEWMKASERAAGVAVCLMTPVLVVAVIELTVELVMEAVKQRRRRAGWGE